VAEARAHDAKMTSERDRAMAICEEATRERDSARTALAEANIELSQRLPKGDVDALVRAGKREALLEAVDRIESGEHMRPGSRTYDHWQETHRVADVVRALATRHDPRPSEPKAKPCATCDGNPRGVLLFSVRSDGAVNFAQDAYGPCPACSGTDAKGAM
jgi:hypothetical protein